MKKRESEAVQFRAVRAITFALAAVLATCTGSFLCSCSSDSSGINTPGSVLQYHNGPGRDGVYVDHTLTKASAATLSSSPLTTQ